MAALNELETWQRRGLYGTVAALTASGLVWLAIHYGLGAGRGELPHPLEAWLLRLHGATAFASLFFAGVLAARHIPRGWHMTHDHPRLRSRRGSQRRTGVALCALGGALAASGYVLYYFTPEDLRPALGIGHAVVGALLSLLLPLHALRRGAMTGR